MNKIFKVVWSKVRNCYVVVSEMAKNTVSGVGKRNRVNRLSLGATLAAAVLTSGFFMPSEGLAAVLVPNSNTDYLAIGTTEGTDNPFGVNGYPKTGRFDIDGDGDNENVTYVQTSSGIKYYLTEVKNNNNVSVGKYWVREGFGVKYNSRKLHDNAATDKLIDLYVISGLNGDYSTAVTSGEHTLTKSKVTTAINGTYLNELSYHTYGAITNSPTTAVTDDNQFFIRRERLDNDPDKKGYEDVGAGNLKNNFYVFKNNELNSKTGKYQFNGVDVEYDDVYLIKDKDSTAVYIGVFLTEDVTNAMSYNSSTELVNSAKNDNKSYNDNVGVYGGSVFGYNNEILTTGYNSSTGKWSSVWGGEISDPHATIQSMTVNEFNQIMHHLHLEDVKLADADIVTTRITNGNNSGQINLINKAGNQVPGLVVQSVAETGEDTKITFTDTDNNVLELDAGSRVSVSQDGEAVSITVNGNTTNLYDAYVQSAQIDGSNLVLVRNDGVSFSVALSDIKDGMNLIDNDSYIEKVSLSGNTLKFDYNDNGKESHTIDLSSLTSSLGTMSKWTAKVGSASFDVTNNEFVEYVAGNNISLSADTTGQKITVATKNDVAFNRVTVGGSGGSSQVVINNSGINMNNQKIIGLQAGVNNTDAVNVQQLKDTQTRVVSANDNAHIAESIDANGQRTYTVEVHDMLYDVEIKSEGLTAGRVSEYTIKDSDGHEVATIVDTDRDTNTVTKLVEGGDISIDKEEKEGEIIYTVTATDTTLRNDTIEPSVSDDGVTNTYTIQDTSGATTTFTDVASAAKLKTVINDVTTNANNITSINNILNSDLYSISASSDGKINLTNSRTGKVNSINVSVAASGSAQTDDVKVTFGTGNNAFTVTTGSLVDATGVDGNVLTQLTINGHPYDLVHAEEVAYLNNLNVNHGSGKQAYLNNAANENEKHGWQLVDQTQKDANNNIIIYRDTTLDTHVSKTEVDSGVNYTIYDTAGNAVVLNDVASASKLQTLTNDVATNTTNISNLTTKVNGNITNINNILNGNLVKLGVDGTNKEIALFTKGNETSNVKVIATAGHDDKDATLRFSSNNGANKFDVSVGSTVRVTAKNTRNNEDVMYGITVNGEYYVVEDTTLDPTNSGAVKEVKDGQLVVGRDYVIADTSGKTVELKDMASASYVRNKVTSINQQITSLSEQITTEAARDVIVDNADDNIVVTSSISEGDTTYHVSLDDDISVAKTISVGEDENILLNGLSGSVLANTFTARNSITVGDVVITASEITGLDNRTWNQEATYNEGRAATEEQLQAAINKIKTSTTNNYNELIGNDIEKIVVSSNAQGGTVDLMRKTGVVVPGTLQFTSGGGVNGFNTKVTISNDGNESITLNTGSAVKVYTYGNITTAPPHTISGIATMLEVNGMYYNLNTIAPGTTYSATDYHLVNDDDEDAPTIGVDSTNNTYNKDTKAYKPDENGVVTLYVEDRHDKTGATTGHAVANVYIADVASASKLEEVDGRLTTVETTVSNIKNNITNVAGKQIESGSISEYTYNNETGGSSTITLVTNTGGESNIEISGLRDTTLKAGNINAVETKGEDGRLTSRTYTFSDTNNNQVVLNDVASASKLQDVEDKMYYNDQVLLQSISNNSQHLDSRINQVNSRVNKVGAGAAALAALHPMDFDPDDKLSFAVGAGNYAGENATAIGAFYRPNEKVMMSVGGTYGNGENMVNMGVSFALDKTNNVSNSRTAMAREIVDLREQVATQGQQIAQLVALVQQLAGVQQPVVPQDQLFPDIPENHWAYEYVHGLAAKGIIEGYPDGTFGGDRAMTRYEFAAMLFRALEKGVVLSEQIRQEFEPELGRIRVDRIKGTDADLDKIERVRVNTAVDRDDYGSKVVQVKH